MNLKSLTLLVVIGHMTWADVFVLDRDTGEKVKFFQDAAASFGRSIPDEGIKGVVIKADPLNGCSHVEPPSFELPPDLVPIALIARYGCNFETKVRHATWANFSAVIIYDNNSDKLVPMGGSERDLIPSVFIGHSDAQQIMKKYLYPDQSDFVILITGEEPFNIGSYLLPFAIVIGISFLIMLGVILFKCLQDYRRSRRHRLPRSALKKLPIVEFKEGDPYETCCICLEDYVEGEKLRVLPCDHGYHSKCIDPWLVENKRICPQCRKRVFDDSDSTTDSETEEETAPLLRASNRPSTSRGGGTFVRNAASRAAIERANFGRSLREHLDQDLEAGPSHSTRVLVPRSRISSTSSDDSEVSNPSTHTPAEHRSAVIHTNEEEDVPSVLITSVQQEDRNDLEDERQSRQHEEV